MGGVWEESTHVEKCNTAMAIVVRKRHSYTACYKLTVVEFAEKTNNCPAQRKFGVSKKLGRSTALFSSARSRLTSRISPWCTTLV